MWHLLLHNLKGRGVYNSIIVAAVALALTVALTASFITSGVRKDLEHKQLLLGPALAVVPPGTKEIGHLYLTKGPPEHGFVATSSAGEIRNLPGVESVSMQRLLGTALVQGKSARLIAFDASTDFMVRPWMDKKTAKAPQDGGNSVILGLEIAPSIRIGESVELQGKKYPVAGRLQHTGTFLDASVFFPRAGSELGGEPSWILLGLKPGASVDVMINRLETNIPNIEVIARPEMLKTINDQLYGVVRGGSLNLAAVLVALGALLVTGAMFCLLVYERRREFGLLKALGARNCFVFKLIVGESLALSGLGASLGLVLSAVWLAATGTQIMPDNADVLSGWGDVLSKAGAVLAVIVGVSVMTAVFPALLSARMEPYAAIRAGE